MKMLSIQERLQMERRIWGSDEYRFTKSSKDLSRLANYDRPIERKIIVPFERLFQMFQSNIINNRISYSGTTPCVPGKEYEIFPFSYPNNIYGVAIKYTIPKHLMYEMNLIDYRRLITLMNSEYGDEEGEVFTYYLFNSGHVKILDYGLAVTFLKFIVNLNVERKRERNDRITTTDFYNYSIQKLLDIAEIDDLQFLESIFGEKGKYALDRHNARYEFLDGYDFGASMNKFIDEPINIMYNGMNIDVYI